jgi:hypothetical protein
VPSMPGCRAASPWARAAFSKSVSGPRSAGSAPGRWRRPGRP